MTLNWLSGFDAGMLLLETPGQPMHMVSLAELDVSAFPGGYDFAAFRDEISARLRALPEFRAKLADSPLNVDNPVWVEDPLFHVDRHVHRVQVSAPGGRDELSAVAAELAAESLDRDRPLWDIWVLEGVDGIAPGDSGRVAAGIRTHHVFADGVTSGNLWAQLLEPPIGSAPDAAVEGFGTATSWQIVRGGLARFAKRPWFVVTKLLPASIAALVATARRSTGGQSMSRPFGAPRASFNGRIGTRRSVAYCRISLDDVKTVKDAFGVKVNDVMLALLSGALRGFLITRAALPDSSLVVGMPVSVYEEGQESRNQLSAALVDLHTSIANPADRLRAIAKASSAAKAHTSQLGSSILEDWLHVVPVMMRAALWLAAATGLTGRKPVYNLSFSNVPGVQHHILGAPIVSSYPFGPVMDGVGLNVSAATLNGIIDFGFSSCTDLLPEVSELADTLPSVLDELLAAARREVDGK